MTNEYGLLFAHSLDGHGGSEALSVDDISDWTADKGLLWLHFDSTHPDAERWLLKKSGLDALIAEALTENDPRPRATIIEDGILLSLRGVNHYESPKSDDLISLRIWIDKYHIITTRDQKSAAATAIDRLIKKTTGPTNSGDFLVKLLDLIVDGMADTIADYEENIADYEDALLTDNTESLRHQIGQLRRQTISLRRYLAPERDALSRLLIENVSWINSYQRVQIHEIHDNLIRYIESLDAVRERAALVHEELQSRMSEQLNSRMYVLSVVAALFLPLGFLTGLFGINLGGIPGANDQHAFWDFVLILSIVVALLAALFHWKKWF